MAVNISTGVMNSLLVKLEEVCRYDLAEFQFSTQFDFKNNIWNLKEELSCMNALLEKLPDMEALNIQERELRNKVRELAYFVEDKIDMFMHSFGTAVDKATLLTDTMELMLPNLFAKIDEIKDYYAVEEVKRVERYNLDVDECISSNPRQIDEIDDDISPVLCGEANSLVGINVPCEVITQLLMEDMEGESGQHPKVLSIVGLGGLGKSTLAIQVYNKIHGRFECAVFVFASRNRSASVILKDILSQLKYDGSADGIQSLIDATREKLACKRSVVIASGGCGFRLGGDGLGACPRGCGINGGRRWIGLEPSMGEEADDEEGDSEEDEVSVTAGGALCLFLRFLVVIDDISSIETWNSISGAFVENNSGSRIITTTRTKDVANACCSSFRGIVYKMKPLGWTDSRSLFFRRLYGSDNYIPEPEELVIVVDILRKCGGVPLAIVVIASLLASQREVNKLDNWLKIKNSMGFELETNPNSKWMKHILKLSYNNLSWDLKTCLLYLHMYPENINIMKKDLVRQWIAEGFITQRDNRDLEDIAESYFRDLINRSLIKPVQFKYGEVVSCRVVHNLLLDLIVEKSTEENFVTVISTDQDCSRRGNFLIRRLNYRSNCGNIIQASESLHQVRSITYFGNWLHQRGESLPRLRMFKALRFPDTIGELRYLQVVDINCGTNLVLVGGFLSDACLPSLRHLRAAGSEELGRGINRLTSIRTLEGINFCNCSVENIRHLGVLTNLRTLSVIYNRRRGNDEDDLIDMVKFAALATSLRELGGCNLRCLDFRVVLEGNIRQPPISFLCSWSPPPQFLQRCHLYKAFHRVPYWIQQVETLTSLCLKVVELKGDDMRVLSRLPCLAYLDLQVFMVPGMEIIIDSVSFSVLKELKLTYGSSTSSLSIEPGAMPKLRIMHLIVFGQAEQDTKSLYGIQHLHSLEDVIITSDYNNVLVSFREALDRHPRIGSIQVCIGASSDL
uniref:NB-ARC domain-containing protein n=1 Tax=Oryza rufipogon TaxID=4529 RepID=A0A0E0RH50_ORYRU